MEAHSEAIVPHQILPPTSIGTNNAPVRNLPASISVARFGPRFTEAPGPYAKKRSGFDDQVEYGTLAKDHRLKLTLQCAPSNLAEL